MRGDLLISELLEADVAIHGQRHEEDECGVEKNEP